MSTRWTPGFLSRIFFKGNWAIEVSPKGLKIDGRVHSWESLTQCSVERTLLWGHLQMQFAAEEIALRGMPISLANEMASCAKAFQTLLPAIVALRTAMASERYVANKTVREILAIASAAAQRWSLDQAPRVAADLEPLRPDLEFIRQVASGNYSEIEARNNQFISTEMAIHEDFFKTVETSVLTSEQRVATIVMEDRNLVIAAAGSGKTSVLVAKVGYLVKKGYRRCCKSYSCRAL